MSPDKPGEYPNLAMPDYLNTPAVNATIVKAIRSQCAYAAWWESWLNPQRPRSDDDASDASDAGTIAHSIVLEGGMGKIMEIDPAVYPSKTGSIPEGWTNKAIRDARDAARLIGQIPVLTSKLTEIKAMAESVAQFVASLAGTEPAICNLFKPDGGDSELTFLWDDDGVLCRNRPDRIAKDRKLVVDLKFTEASAEPASWGRKQFIGMGYSTSAAFCLRGIRRQWNVTAEYVFVVCEQRAPYLCSLVGVDPAWGAHGAFEVEKGLAEWRACVERGRWPGYATRVCYPELPAWMMKDWENEDGIHL